MTNHEIALERRLARQTERLRALLNTTEQAIEELKGRMKTPNVSGDMFYRWSAKCDAYEQTAAHLRHIISNS